MISYNVTYKNLIKECDKYELDKYDEADSEIVMPGAMVYQMPGGMEDLFERVFDDDKYLRTITGEKNVFNYIDGFKQSILDRKTIPDFVDAESCLNGCEYGHGSIFSKNQNP